MNAKTKGIILSPQNAILIVGLAFNGGVSYYGSSPPQKQDTTQIYLNKAKDLEQDEKLKQQREQIQKLELKIDDIPAKVMEEFRRELEWRNSRRSTQ
jgi:hypothetical protein